MPRARKLRPPAIKSRSQLIRDFAEELGYAAASEPTKAALRYRMAAYFRCPLGNVRAALKYKCSQTGRPRKPRCCRCGGTGYEPVVQNDADAKSNPCNASRATA